MEKDYTQIVGQKYVYRVNYFDYGVILICAMLVGGPLPRSPYLYPMWITMENIDNKWNFMSKIRLSMAA